MAQGKTTCCQACGPALISGSHMVAGENQFPQVILCFPHACYGMHICMSTHTSKLINVKCILKKRLLLQGKLLVNISQVFPVFIVLKVRQHSILIGIPMLWLNTMNRSHLGENFSLPRSWHTPSPREVGEGTQGRNLEARTTAEAAKEHCLWLVHQAFLSLPFCTSRDHLPRVAPLTLSWALPHHSLVKKIPHRLAYGLVLGKHFLSWSTPFPNEASLCHVDNNNNNQERQFVCVKIICRLYYPWKHM